ncbi:microcystin-dependent protein [Pseudomonas sp. JAI115]|uniref:phage tail-collar fiber domain-containing protein n=1 Tax=Pseudomonas sp. JAI115 TaxID=2723061 RepID=UPI00161D1177|nr:phage tail protein [Pseudomonas sp. JAI115]MBB6158525.1 microcystin-dependent protein [Pseudomonas sp. JAI115]
MSAIITLAGERQIAQKQGQQQPLLVSRFIFANVPGLDPQTPVDHAAGKPEAAHIVYVYAIPKENAGFVNPNQVVYSAQLGSDIGDWDFNWVGLEDEDGVLFAVSHVPLQQKRKNIPPLQIGNNLTRNFLVAYDGAQALTGVTIDASTWQHDFTVRLAGIDERERQSNRDLFGRACFLGQGFAMTYDGSHFWLTPGTGYVEGIRVNLTQPFPVTVLQAGNVCLDVCLERDLNDRVASFTTRSGDWADYTDASGQRHYCVPLGNVGESSIIDLRVTVPMTEPVIQALAFRDGDYPKLRARGTTKDDVELGNLPNAKSDDPKTNSSQILATTAALNNLEQQIHDPLVGMIAAFDTPHAPPGWLKRNGANVSRTAYARLFAVLGTRYGAGDGHTTFNIGDSRGLFIRAWDDGRGIDTGRALGSHQPSQNAAHAHGAVSGEAGHHAHGGHIDAGGWHSHSAWASEAGAGITTKVLMGGQGINFTGEKAGSVMGSNSGGVVWRDFAHTANPHSHAIGIGGEGNHTHGLNIYGGGGHAHPVTVYPDGGNEARPLNEALLICIKY